jgi:hypothetical protein
LLISSSFVIFSYSWITCAVEGLIVFIVKDL